MNNASGFEFAFGDAPERAKKAQRKQPVQSRSQATCAAICEATIQVLVREGAGRLTTTRVARRAGVSVGTLYQYYPNKAALTEAVRAEYFALMSAEVQEAIASAQGATPKELLGRALAAVVAVKRQNLTLSLALAEIPTDPAQPDFSAEIVEHFAEFLLPLLSRGATPTEAQRAHALAIIAAVEGALSYAVKNAPRWLEEPWFLDQLRVMATSGLPDPL